jgi:small subunit ribosomal protein S9
VADPRDEERDDAASDEGTEPQAAAEDTPAAEAETPDDAPEAPAEGGPPAEPAEEGATPEDDAPETKEPAAPEPAAEEAEDAGGDEKPKAADQPPGAELEPIAIEPERELSAEERAKREAEAEERARREAEATAEEGAEEPAAKAAVKLEGDARFTATGKRKSSIARVILLPGEGKVEVNKRELDTYFPRSLHQSMARQPLVATGYDGNVDVRVRVHGGGIAGQAGAVRHGIARALVEIDPELRGELKRRGYLTRDAREKERRKAGLKKARKRPQFSKR